MYTSAQKWNEFYRRMQQKAASLVDPATGRVAQHLVQTIPCPVCGSGSSRIRIVKHGFTYVTCNECSFLYMNPQLTQETIREVYNDKDVREFFFRELLLPHVERDQRPEFERRLDDLQKITEHPQLRLLDIGCAAGLFLLLAQRRGFQAEGLELNNLYVDYMRTNRHLKVHARLLEDMRYPDAAFDVATLWDVLEHLPKPMDTLREIARILRQHGIVALTTINHNCINERILKDRWRYYMPPDHLCSFTPQLLASLLRKCGFTIVRMEHQYMFEVLADERLTFLRLSAGSGFSSGLLNKAKKALYLLLAFPMQGIFGILRRGDLLTVYARKS